MAPAQALTGCPASCSDRGVAQAVMAQPRQCRGAWTPCALSQGPSLQAAFVRRHSRRRQRSWQCRATKSRNTKLLPIFPLGLVAFPACSTPLMIFEAR